MNPVSNSVCNGGGGGGGGRGGLSLKLKLVVIYVKMELCANTSNLIITPDITSDCRGQNVTWNYMKLNFLTILT